MKIERAIEFISSQGNAVELARLRFLLKHESPSPEIVALLFTGQQADGGWLPFWAQDYSSLDATCFRLAQAEQLGVTRAEPALQHALHFLCERQSAEGSWEEDAAATGLAPPWAAPGELNAKLYLTANCGLWLALLGGDSEMAVKAGAFLLAYLNANGILPSFRHTCWLAGGLWHKLGWQEPAERVFDYLKQNLADLAASELAWLLTTLCAVGTKRDLPLARSAAKLLSQKQLEDGRWCSADGPGFNVHTTLEACRALKYFE